MLFYLRAGVFTASAFRDFLISGRLVSYLSRSSYNAPAAGMVEGELLFIGGLEAFKSDAATICWSMPLGS